MTEDTEGKIKRVSDEIRSWGAIAVVGSGASLQLGFPLTSQLQALLWHAIDSDPKLRDQLAASNGWPGRATKEMIADDSARSDIALRAVASSQSARDAYQRGFAHLNDARITQPSLTHDALSELLHRRAVETVVSLNWDTLLEASYKRRYGRNLLADGTWLHKPHGDAARPEVDWILPCEPGSVPEALLGQIQSMIGDRPRVLLIVGYSETDENVVNNLIVPLSAHWRVVRIGPSVNGDWDIRMLAEHALPKLVRSIYPEPETQGWEYVGFDQQHDLGRALAGERLGPKDVVTCPRLPEVESVRQQLLVTNSAVIIGASGSGKSITGYQSAYDLHRDDWEVLRLVDPNRRSDDLLLAIGDLPCRTVLLIDDAQAIDENLTRRLLEDASDERNVIVITTDEMPSQANGVRVAGTRAVSIIAEVLRTARREETLRVVRQLDNRIGEGYMDTSLEWRIEDAAREETPWRFSYILTGGERRSRAGIAALRDEERADLLLASVAAGQLASSDKGASREWLEATIEIFGRDTDWLSNSLRILRERRFVIGDEWVTCIHQRFAVVALESIYGFSEVAWNELTRMLRAAVLFGNPPLVGVYSLLYAVRSRSAFPGSLNGVETIVDDDVWQVLMERCWNTRPGHDRRSAISILTELLAWHPRTLDAIASQTALLGDWLETTDAESALGFRWLLNDLSNKEAVNLVEDICNHADTSVLASSISRAGWTEAYAWGSLMAPLWRAPEEWRTRLVSNLSVASLHALIESVPGESLYQLDEFLHGVRALDQILSLQLVEPVIPALARAVNANPASAFHSIHQVVWYLFGYPPAEFMRVPISGEQKRLARLFARSLDAAAIGAAISNNRRRDWRTHAELLMFLRQTDRKQVSAIVAAIDFEMFDQSIQGMWASPPHELVQLIGMLDSDRKNDESPIRCWFRKHAKEYGCLDITLATLDSEEAISRLRAGVSLDLELQRGNWVGAFLALASLSKVDEAIAVEVLESNRVNLSEALVRIEKWDSEVVGIFVKALQEETPHVLTAAVSGADPQKASQNWTSLLRGRAKDKKAAAIIINAAEAASEPIASVAKELRRRFPHATAV